jgi:hypothetical protein
VLSGRTQEEIAGNLPARKAKRKIAGATDRVWESDRPAKKTARKPASKEASAKPAKKKLPAGSRT